MCRYIINELMGKGTFGQVVKCTKRGTGEEYAIKVIKNRPAYTRQALIEIKVFIELQEQQQDEKNRDLNESIVKMTDYFIFQNHVCIIFEVLHISLLDLLQATRFTGFPLRLIKTITCQLLSGILCLENKKIIHCDLKPENILFKE